MGYELGDFVRDLRRIAGEAADDRTIVARVGPLARELALGKTWLESLLDALFILAYVLIARATWKQLEAINA